MVVMAVEQLPCSPREVSSKEECRSSDLWEPRMFQVSDSPFLGYYPSALVSDGLPVVHLGLRSAIEVEGRKSGSRRGIIE